MKKIIHALFICTALNISAQQALYIPDTLSGTSFNLNLHPDSVQFFPGTITQTNGFNAYKYLGPTLLLKKNDVVNMTVNNQLLDTTTIHWHGLHVASMNDGGPHTMIMSTASWNPQFKIMNSAATYWYHPHLHKKTAMQAMRGAAGLIIVRDSLEALLNIPRRYGVDDYPIIVQSQQFDSLNQVDYKGMEDSILLVNGAIANYSNSVYANVPSQVIRMRLLGGSQERTYNFGFTGNKSFYVIGNDGGLLQAPVSTTRIRLSPGERAEILLDLTGMNGQTIYLMSYASEIPMGVQGGPTMPMSGGPPMDSPLNGIDFNILQLNVGAQTVNPITTIPATLIPDIPLIASQANITRIINFTALSMMSMDGPFFFNDSTFDMMRIDYTIPLNNIEIWQLSNQTMVAHPFHIHDVNFYILDRDGNLPGPEERGKKDVVLVAPNETVRFITKFTDFVDSVIPYMYHCHILMHEDDGMMGQFVVVQAATGINSFNTTDAVSVFPNPTNGIFTLAINASETENYNMEVRNSLGQTVLTDKFTTKGIKTKKEISLMNLGSGVYTLILQSDQNKLVQKIIVH